MTGEELCTKLYQRMTAEQEHYRKWLLGQPPDKMLSHALEYAIREDIVDMAKEGELPLGQAGTLLKSRTPLQDRYTVLDQPPTNGKDVNDLLQRKLGLTHRKEEWSR